MSFRIYLFLFLLLGGVISAQDIPRSHHIWVLTEENHSFEDVVDNSQMPYYNQLIKQYGLATQFYADQHSSLPALMWYVAGAPVETDNNTVSCNHGNDNIVRELVKKGYTWRSYQQDMPTAGYQGLYGGPNNVYARRHNPLIDFTDVCPGTGQDTNSVPYDQMATDYAQGKVINYAYVTPALTEDAHDGTLAAADQWLQANLPAILGRPEFQPGGDGILFLIWDEGTLSTDNRCSASVANGCGGRVATLVIGPRVKPGYRSTTLYHSENVLKTICVAMGLTTCPGAAQNAAPMADFFTNGIPSGQSDGIAIAAPGDGATIVGDVHLIATASESEPVSQTQVWDNGVKLGVYGSQIDAIYKLAAGHHVTTVLDLDSSYRILHQAAISYTVQPLTNGIQILSPTANQTISLSTVNIIAHANESVPVNQIQIWDNGVKLGWYAGTTVNQYFTLTPGYHTVTVLDLDGSYNVIHQASVSYSVQ